MRAALYVTYHDPREWTPEEVALVEEVAELTWDAVARARAESTLRGINQDLEVQVGLRTRERDRIWQLSRDPFVVCDLDGVWLAASPAWTDILDWTEEELVGKTADWIEHPDDRGKARREAHALRYGGTSLRFENRLRDRDGAYHWFSWNSVSEEGRIHCAARDVTEERARTAALRDSEMRARAVFQTSNQYQAFMAMDGPVLDANAASLTGAGITFDDVAGMPFWDTPWFSATDGMPARVREAMAFAAAGNPFRGEVELVLPGGARRFDLTIRPVFDDAREVVAVVWEAIDLTDQRAAEEQLRQAQKMEAVGQLTGGVAHDFNNLLTVIRSSVDLMRRPDLPEERRRRYVDAISDTVDRAGKLTSQLLAFARRQTLRPEVLDAGAAVMAVGDMVRTISGSRIAVTIDVPAGPCLVNADASQFDTAIVNMAVNARDAMDGEGTLAIAVTVSDGMPAMRGQDAVAGAFVAVTLTDSGSGIPAERLGQIFEPFFTTKGVGHGTGLGLSQVFGFAKQSGGEVMVLSEVGKGAAFTLYLPRVMRAAIPLPEEAEPEPLVDGHGTRVLVVEDNEQVGAFSTGALQELGYVTVHARDGIEALGILSAGGMAFDAVFSDVVMPRMDGLALAGEVRRLHPGMPVILTSGYSHVLAQEGTHGYELLGKPYSVEELSRALRRAVPVRKG